VEKYNVLETRVNSHDDNILKNLTTNMYVLQTLKVIKQKCFINYFFKVFYYKIHNTLNVFQIHVSITFILIT